MAAPRHSGTRTRTLPDWYSADLAAAYGIVLSCPGHFQAFGIYNNATDGSVLRVYAVELWNNMINGFVLFSLIQGQPFPTSSTSYGPIDPLGKVVPGIPNQGGSAALLGKQIGAIFVLTTAPRTYAPGFAFARVQPNWTFFLQQNNAGQELDAAIWYLNSAD